MVNAGVEINLTQCFFMDLFVDYNFGKLKLSQANLLKCSKSCSDPCNPCTTENSNCCNPCNPCTTNNSNCCNPCNPCTTDSTDCGSCCPSCCFDLKLGGVVAGIGLGYKF